VGTDDEMLTLPLTQMFLRLNNVTSPKVALNYFRGHNVDFLFKYFLLR